MFNLLNFLQKNPQSLAGYTQQFTGGQGGQNNYQGGNPNVNSWGNRLKGTQAPTITPNTFQANKTFAPGEEEAILSQSLGKKKPVFGQNTEEEILANSLSTPDGQGKMQLGMDENLLSQQLANDPRLQSNSPQTIDDDHLAQTSTPTTQDITDNIGETLGATNWTGALIGAGAGIVNELLGGEDEMVKQKQAWLDEMENRNRANNETIRATNSESNRRGAMMGLNQAKSGAMAQAANIGAGQALGSGLGGDVSSQQIAGVKAAAPVMAAAGQFGQAEAGLMGQKAQEDAQRNQDLINNQNAGTNIESQRLYLNKNKGTNWLNAIAGGTGIWKNIVDAMPKSTGTHT